MEDIRTYRIDEDEPRQRRVSDDDRKEYSASPQLTEEEVPFHIPRD
jgi:hypothetical protein